MKDVWRISAQFDGLQAAGETLRRLGALFFSQPDYAAWRIVLPGDALYSREGELVLVNVLTTEPIADQYVADRIADIFRSSGGTPIDPFPRVLTDRCLMDWRDRLELERNGEPPQAPSLMFLSTLDNPTEDPLVVTSHAKCRDCGGQRHKIARLNLCQSCWERVKPAVRREWREIKDRKRLREAVDAHIEEQRRQREIQEELVALRQARQNARKDGSTVQLTDQEAATREIARIRAEGTVPPMGTPERVQYMRLFQIANGGQQRTADDLDHLLGRLYTETRIQVKDIMYACGVDNNRMRRMQFRLKIPNRDDIEAWHELPMPPAGSKLVVADGVAWYRFPDGIARLVFSDTEPVAGDQVPEQEPEEAPAAEAEQQPELAVVQADDPTVNGVVHEEPAELETVADEQTELTTKGRPRQRAFKGRQRLTEEDRAEIARWYDDMSIPISEIKAAYGLAGSTLDGIVRQFGLVQRSQRMVPGAPKQTVVGRFELIDGKHQWVRGAPEQLHLGQAELLITSPQEVPVAAEPEIVSSNDGAKLAVLPTVRAAREQAYAVRYVVARMIMVTATDVGDAIRRVHDSQGDDVEITDINRA